MRINYDILDLQAFVAVAERASFRHAAADVFLSQSALSRRIDKLEESLGVPSVHAAVVDGELADAAVESALRDLMQALVTADVERTAA